MGKGDVHGVEASHGVALLVYQLGGGDVTHGRPAKVLHHARDAEAHGRELHEGKASGAVLVTWMDPQLLLSVILVAACGCAGNSLVIETFKATIASRARWQLYTPMINLSIGHVYHKTCHTGAYLAAVEYALLCTCFRNGCCHQDENRQT